ncbi:hypothetical protein [Streptomyces goshikiensis]|uniref:hypothetical protein n=1 Tax=Streptomyces goshikiensis TaxID=1942 RepID=UPI0036941CED
MPTSSPRPRTVDVPGIGTLTVHDTVLPHGRVRFKVTGPHIKGTFILIPEAQRGGSILPTTVQVQYGDGLEPQTYYTPRPDEPVVYRVGVHGHTDGLDPYAVPTHHFLGRYAIASGRSFLGERLPDGARQRTEEVVRCLLRLWGERDDADRLKLAAATARADEHARHEDQRAEHLDAEIEKVQAQRVAARRTVNQLTGILRRRPTAVLPADPTPARVPFFDRHGQQMGVLTVQETPAPAGTRPGSVIYTVAGSRVAGSFTVERYRYGSTPWPEGIHATYGIPTSRYGHEARDEPVINTVRLSGGWSSSGDTARITHTTPDRLPTQIRLSRTTSCSAPEATERRASGVLRALALRYLARPDAEALHLAAAKDRAPGLLTATRSKLKELREQQRKLTRQAAAHRARAAQYRELLAPPRTLPDIQSDPSGALSWEDEGGAVAGVPAPRPVPVTTVAPELAEALQVFVDVAERAVRLASTAADAAERAAARSRGRDTAKRDEAMWAAHYAFKETQKYAKWAEEDAGTVTASTLRNYVNSAIDAAERAQLAAGKSSTTAELRDLIAEPWTQARADEEARREQERREWEAQYEAEERERTGLDADNRIRLIIVRDVAAEQVPNLGWSQGMVSVMKQAATGQMYYRDGSVWNGRRRVSRERTLMLARAGFVSIGPKPDRRIGVTPMGDTALYLVGLHPDGIHPDDKAAYEARYVVARRLRRNKEDTKTLARQLPRIDQWTQRRCARPVTLVEQDRQAAELAEQTWADEGGAIPDVDRPQAAGRRAESAVGAGRIAAKENDLRRPAAARRDAVLRYRGPEAMELGGLARLRPWSRAEPSAA